MRGEQRRQWALVIQLASALVCRVGAPHTGPAALRAPRVRPASPIHAASRPDGATVTRPRRVTPADARVARSAASAAPALDEALTAALAQLEAQPGARIASWLANYRALAAFVAREGDADVPLAHVEGDVRLGRWLSRQRAAQRDGALIDEQHALLEGLGVVWSVHERAWHNAVAAARAFRAREGHLRVPQAHVEGGVALAGWIEAQRKSLRALRLSSDRLADVLELEIDSPLPFKGDEDARSDDGAAPPSRSADAQLDARLPLDEALPRSSPRRNEAEAPAADQPLRAQQGDSEPDGEAEAALALARASERAAADAARAATRRATSASRWERAHSALRAFVEREGHADVPIGHCEPLPACADPSAASSLRLDAWLDRQRAAHAAGKLDGGQARALVALGVQWVGKAERRWELYFDALQAFHAQEGHWCVPRTHVADGLRLGDWLRNQRLARSRGSLDEARALRLQPYFNTERAAIARGARRAAVTVSDALVLPVAPAQAPPAEQPADGALAAAAEAEAVASAVDPAAAAEAAAAAAAAEPALSRPPGSFKVLLEQAARASQRALADGLRFVEVEFPPIPTRVLADATSRDLFEANLRLALSFAAALGVPTAVTVADGAALALALELTGGRASTAPNVRLHALTSEGGGDFPETAIPIFGRLWQRRRVVAAPWAEVYVLLLPSSASLVDAQDLAQRDPSKPLVFFNNKLDVLRGELGLPTFPRRALQHRFLSFVRPVYLFASKTYAASLTRPPYVLPFSGALFRVYPQDYQTLLDTGKGSYRRVGAEPSRPANAAFRETLVNSLCEVRNVDESTLLTRTFRSKTWFEEDARRDDLSSSWRS
jgi:hypothetical protein